MPAFIVTSPDGKKFQVNAPDGASQDQVLAYAQQQFSQQAAPPAAAPPATSLTPRDPMTGAPSAEPIPVSRPFASQAQADGQQQARTAATGRSISGEPMPGAPRGDFNKGLQTGLDTTSASLYGLAALVGDSTDNAPLRDWGLKYHQQYMDAAAQNAPRVSGLEDVHSIGDFFDYTAGMIGASLPFLATSALGGGVGGLIGKSVAKGAVERLVAKGLGEEAAAVAVKRALSSPATQAKILGALKTGTVAGAFVANSAQLQGDLYGQLKSAGIEDAAAPAWAYGAAQGALFTLPEASVLAKLVAPKGVEQELSAAIARGLSGKVAEVTKGTVKQASIAGVAGAGVSALSALARIQSGGDQWGTHDTQAVIDNLAGGAILGTIIGGGAETLARLTAKQTPAGQQTRAPEATTQEPKGDLGAQFKSMMDPAAGRDSMLVPVGQHVSAATGTVTAGYYRVPTTFGTVLTTSAEKAARLKANPKLSSEQMGEVLYGTKVTPKSESDGTVVQARDAQGNITAQVATNDANKERDSQAVQQTVGPQAQVEQTTADAVIAERKARADNTVSVELGPPALDDAAIVPAREDHVVALLQPLLRKTPEGRAALEKLRNDPTFRRTATEQYFGGGVNEEQLAATLSGRVPAAESATGVRPVEADYRTDLTGYLESGTLEQAPPDERLAFYRWLNTEATPPANRVAYDSWHDRNATAASLYHKFSSTESTDSISPSASVIGQKGTLHGVRDFTGAKQIAEPWSTSRRAEEMAAKLDISDVDSHHIVRAVSAGESLRRGLGGEGYYVFAEPKAGADLYTGRRLGAPMTEPQLGRQTIQNAIARFKALPKTLREGVGKRGEPQYGVKFVRVDKNGTRSVVTMDARTITKSGIQAAPELHAAEIAAPERLWRGFQRGMALVVGTEYDGARYEVLHTSELKGRRVFDQPGSGKLVLRESFRKPESAVTLGDTARALDAMSAAGETSASRGPASRNAGINAPQQAMGEAGHEGGRAQTFVDQASPAQAAAIEAVPAFERGHADPNDPVLRDADSEAQQNRRSTQIVSPNDTFTVEGGNSDIGMTTAPSEQATSTEPSMVRADLTGSRGHLRVGVAKVVTQLRSALNLETRIHIVDSTEAVETSLLAAGHSSEFAAAARASQEARNAAGEQVYGTMWPGDASRHATIWMNDKITTSDARFVKTLSHEIGHLFYREHWDKATTQTRAALNGAYEKALDSNPREVARLNKYGYERGLEEWMADQLAGWVAENRAPQTVFEKFLDHIVQGFKQIWATISEHYKVSGEFDEFVRGIVNPKDFAVGDVNEGAFDSLGVGKSAFDHLGRSDEDMNPALDAQRGAWRQALKGMAEHPKVESVLDFAKANVNAVGGSLISSIQARVRRMKIEGFNKILRQFHLRPGEVGGHTFYTESHARIQTFEPLINSALKGLSKEGQQTLLREMQSERGVYSSRNIAKRAAKLRGFFDDVRKYQLDSGLPVMKVEDYFPQVADAEQLGKADAFQTIKDAITKAGVTVDDDKLTAMISRLSDDGYAVNYDPKIVGDNVDIDFGSPFAQALQPRYMDPKIREAIRSVVDADGQSRFYAKDLYKVLYTYTAEAVKRAEFNRRLGDTTWMRDIQPDGTQRDFNPRKKLESMLEEAKTQGASQHQMDFMGEALQAFLGQYKRIKSEAVRQMQNGLLTYSNLRVLGMVFFSSIPDLANISVRNGDMKATLASIARNASEAWRANQPGLIADQLRVLGHASDTVDQLGIMNFAEIKDSPMSLSRKINEKFMRVIGMHRWTAFTRGMALRIGADYIKRHAEGALAGKEDSVRRLQELDLTPADVHNWAAGDEKFTGEEGAAKTDSVRKVSGAISRFINEAVVHAEPPEKTLWGNAETTKLLWNLKNFMYGYTSRILGRLWHEISRDGATTEARAQMALSMGMTIGLTMLGLEAKNIVQYGLWGNQNKKQQQMSAAAYLESIANRSGAFGVAQYGLDIGEARASGRAPLLAALGPTLGQMNDFLQYPLYRQVPGAIPGLSYFPGARDWAKAKLKGQQ